MGCFKFVCAHAWYFISEPTETSVDADTRWTFEPGNKGQLSNPDFCIVVSIGQVSKNRKQRRPIVMCRLVDSTRNLRVTSDNAVFYNGLSQTNTFMSRIGQESAINKPGLKLTFVSAFKSPICVSCDARFSRLYMHDDDRTQS